MIHLFVNEDWDTSSFWLLWFFSHSNPLLTVSSEFFISAIVVFRLRNSLKTFYFMDIFIFRFLMRPQTISLLLRGTWDSAGLLLSSLSISLFSFESIFQTANCCLEELPSGLLWSPFPFEWVILSCFFVWVVILLLLLKIGYFNLIMEIRLSFPHVIITVLLMWRTTWLRQLPCRKAFHWVLPKVSGA